MKFADYSRRWRDQILVLKKPATQASMNSYVRKLDKHFGQLELEDLTESRVQDHISQIAKDVSARSVWNYWGTLRLILNRAKREGLIQNVPEPVLPKKLAPPQSCLTLEEMRVLSKLDPMYFLLAETGLRIGEALGLKKSDIDFANGQLTVNRSVFNGKEQSPKTQNAFRTISISLRLQKALFGLPEGYLFPQSPNKTSRKLRSALMESKIFRGGSVWKSCHGFRRGNATLSAAIGMPIKMISYRHGRATGDLTTDVYIQYTVGSDKEFAEKLGLALI